MANVEWRIRSSPVHILYSSVPHGCRLGLGFEGVRTTLPRLDGGSAKHGIFGVVAGHFDAESSPSLSPSTTTHKYARHYARCLAVNVG